MKHPVKTLVFVWLILVLAFTVNPTTPVFASGNQDEVNHTLIPTSGTGKEQVIHDQVNKTTAAQKRAFGGEQFNAGKFERPFDQNMDYLPYLDIVKSTMQREDASFIYVTIQVASPVSESLNKPASYGLVLDPNLDGRSEFLILAQKPVSTEWTVCRCQCLEKHQLVKSCC